eukprot:SAG11_NODE_25327_length_360_cov_0.842912_1_plen_75_part_01
MQSSILVMVLTVEGMDRAMVAHVHVMMATWVHIARTCRAGRVVQSNAIVAVHAIVATMVHRLGFATTAAMVVAHA